MKSILTAISLVALVVALAPIALSRPVALRDQPFPDAPTYADTAFHLANGKGFGTVVNQGARPQPTTQRIGPSRYPPGFPLALAPFIVLGRNNPTSAQTGARWAAGLLVVALFLMSFVLGGPGAAAIASVVSFFSPFALKSSQLVLSDALGAALTLFVVTGVALAWREGAWERRRALMLALAGALAAFAVSVRYSALGLLASVAITARKRRFLAAIAIGAAPVMALLFAYQWTQFGSPVRTGYNLYLPNLVEFSPKYVLARTPQGERKFIFNDKLDGALMRWTCPCDRYGPMGTASNAVFYPATLLGLYWVFYPPLFSLLGIWEIVRRRSAPAGQLGALVVVTNMLLLLGYFYQGGRLVAPAAYVLLAFSAAGLARLLALGGRRLNLPRRRSRHSAVPCN